MLEKRDLRENQESLQKEIRENLALKDLVESLVITDQWVLKARWVLSDQREKEMVRWLESLYFRRLLNTKIKLDHQELREIKALLGQLANQVRN